MSKKHNKHPENANPSVQPVRLGEVNTVLRRALVAVSAIAAENNNLKIVNKSLHESLGKANKEIADQKQKLTACGQQILNEITTAQVERMRADRNERYKFGFWILIAIYTVLFVVQNFVVPHFAKRKVSDRSLVRSV